MPERSESNLVYVRTDEESSEEEVYDEYTANDTTEDFILTTKVIQPLFPKGLFSMK